MINRGLLRQAQQAQDEAQRKQAEEQAVEERKRQQKRFEEVQLVLSRLGVETSTDDMTIVDADDDYAVLIMVGETLTGYPLRVWYQGTAWWIKVGNIWDYFNAGLSGGSVSDEALSMYRARFADMLDAYDAQRAEALEQMKAEFPKPTEPAQDETLDDLAVQVDEAFYELNEYAMYESRELQDLIGKAGQAWREFSKRALAAPRCGHGYKKICPRF